MLDTQDTWTSGLKEEGGPRMTALSTDMIYASHKSRSTEFMSNTLLVN